MRPSDIGRPLADIRPNIEVPELEQSISKVLQSIQPVEREVQNPQGHWHLLNILPYRTQDDKIDGVVLALQDVDAIKAASEQLGDVLDGHHNHRLSRLLLRQQPHIQQHNFAADFLELMFYFEIRHRLLFTQHALPHRKQRRNVSFAVA